MFVIGIISYLLLIIFKLLKVVNNLLEYNFVNIIVFVICNYLRFFERERGMRSYVSYFI